jgi:hypothetical protein
VSVLARGSRGPPDPQEGGPGGPQARIFGVFRVARTLWIFEDLCGSLWIFVDLCGSLWIFVDIASSLIYILVGLRMASKNRCFDSRRSRRNVRILLPLLAATKQVYCNLGSFLALLFLIFGLPILFM